MGSPQDFKSLQEGIQKSLVSTVKTINRITAEDLAFQRTVNPDAAEQLDDKSARILKLSSQLLRSAGKACGVRPPSLEDAEDVDLNWQSIVDVVDSVLEKADTAMDEYTGLIKRKEPPSADAGPKSKRPKSASKVIRNANVTKPQILFEKKPDNFPTGPWKPILTSKPHAVVPLKHSLVVATNDNGTPQYKHPYENEISQMAYPRRLFEQRDPIAPQPADSTAATWIDTFEGVQDMLKHLKQAKEIAVDLEHHDFRTYSGIVCLMQVSTRERDWIVDTLQPWRHKLEILNEVFADPSIVKVFHGAYMDMVWLQRDLGLYVNGLFDTYFACDFLNYPAKSLAFLLSKFVNFDADKQYQLADWRIRPIPEEMLYYARSDTHYLLYIFDHVRNELIRAPDGNERGDALIGQVLDRSKELSLSRHEHPDYNEMTGDGSKGWYNYVFKNAHLALNGEQFAIFKAIWKWRDETARKEDESPNFVLGTNSVVEVARVNPPDIKALHSLLPLTAPLARARLNEIWSRTQDAKAQGGPSLLGFFTSMASHAMARGELPVPSNESLTTPQLHAEVSIVKMPQSMLFGSMPISSRWEESRALSAAHDDTIPFPWQRFIQETNEQGKGQPVDQAMEDVPQTLEVPPHAGTGALEEDDEEFTLKQGRKRRPEPASDSEVDSSSSAEAGPESTSSRGDDVPIASANGVISVVETSARRSKKQRKQELKLQKEQQERDRAEKRKTRHLRKAAKKEKGAGGQEEQKKYQAVPFDYSTATTVMHASTANTEKREPKRIFDPYAATADESIKGARKMPPVRGERSATFKK